MFRLDLDSDREELVAANADPAGWSPAGERILFMRAFDPQETTIIGIFTSKPDGDDEQLVGVADTDDLASPPVWRAGAQDIVTPPSFTRFNARSSCSARLGRLRAQMAKQAGN